MTDSLDLINDIQKQHNEKLIVTGLAALQYPVVQTKQLTFYNPVGGKKDYYIGSHHILIKRTNRKVLTPMDHLLFLAKNIELYGTELNQLTGVLSDISLKDFVKYDKAWRIFAFLKKHCLGEKIELKKSIGRRYIDLGNITGPDVFNDNILHVRDGLFLPQYKKVLWTPNISYRPNGSFLEKCLSRNREYFKKCQARALFNRFCRYASRLESAASAKIEGYDAKVEPHMLSEKVQKRLQKDLNLRANLNMDNLYRDIVEISKTPLTLDLILNVQRAIVHKTWRNEEERLDKTPGYIRPFDEVIVDRGVISKDNVVYVAPKHKDVKLLLNELLDFYHASSNTMHPLDLAAIFHAQLVVIHPFGDGNGRLARWFFLYTLIKKNFIDNVHQAPISEIFLEEKNRYYDELAKVDQSVMNQASYTIDEESKRYHAHYDSVDIYRKLDYGSWLKYAYDIFSRALLFSIQEHEVFEKTEKIYQEFKRDFPNITARQHHEISRAIDIGLKQKWGKKTEQRLTNNGLSVNAIQLILDIIKKIK